MVLENFTTIMWVILAIAAVLILASATGKGKTKKQGQFFMVLGVIGIVAVFAFPAFFQGLDFGGQTAAIGDVGTTGGLPPGTLCAVEDTTVTFSAFNKFTSAATAGTHAYKIDGGSRQTVTDAGTATLSPGDNLEILWLNEANTAGYFGELTTKIIPCKGTFNIDQDLIQNGTLTLNVFNEEGNIIDGNTENETLTTGDVANLKIEIRAANQQGYPHGGILTLELNGTAFDEENTELTFGDLSTTKVPTPQVHTITSTERKTISWELPAFTGASLHTGTLILDVADTNAGIGDTDDPVFTWRPADFYVDGDNGNSFEGASVEDEDNAATVTFAPTTTLSVD